MEKQIHLRKDYYKKLSTVFIDLDKPTATGQIPDNLCITKSISEFEKIRGKGKNILLHFWDPPTEIMQKIAGTPYARLPEFHETIEKQDLKNYQNITKDFLGRDVLSLINPMILRFATLVPERLLKISFLKTFNQSCPLFHVDRLNLRMICTFRGPGTEWISNDMVNRNQLGKGSNRKIIKPEGIIHHLKPFQVCILKGESNNHGLGVVHRSPNVPKNQIGRWYMRIDAIK